METFLSYVAVRAVLERCRAVALHVADDVVDTSWKNDAGPSFAARIGTRAYRVIVSREPEELAHTVVYGPVTVTPGDWVERVVEYTQETSDEPEEIETVEELEEALR